MAGHIVTIVRKQNKDEYRWALAFSFSLVWDPSSGTGPGLKVDLPSQLPNVEMPHPHNQRFTSLMSLDSVTRH